MDSIWSSLQKQTHSDYFGGRIRQLSFYKKNNWKEDVANLHVYGSQSNNQERILIVGALFIYFMLFEMYVTYL